MNKLHFYSVLFFVFTNIIKRLPAPKIIRYEEPTDPESAETLGTMRERIPSNVSICVGEHHYTRYGIKPVLEKYVCDFMMPDMTSCGGPSEMKRMATIMEAYNVLLAPHNPNGPLSTLASANVCASVPIFFRQEFMFNDVKWRDSVIDYPIKDMVKNGHLHLSERPGLGIELVEEEMEKHPSVVKATPGFMYNKTTFKHVSD